MSEITYCINRETQKLELHFDKDSYMSLPEEMKSKIKSTFLFSRFAKAWVSRAKYPNTFYAERIAKELNAVDTGKVGEALSFEEQMNRKAEKAEARAERYENYSDNAIKRGEQLQKPIEDMHGDIAFFTQPNINTSAGRAFTNRRKKMFDAWEKGFEEFKKSEYFKERAEIARRTARLSRPTDKAFIDRRIKDAEKDIRAIKRTLKHYNEELEAINNGKSFSFISGEPITASDIEKWIENSEERLEAAISKAAYYYDCMESAGGVSFSRDNIKPGFIIKVNRWGLMKVTNAGSVNVSAEHLEGNLAGWSLKISYAEVLGIVSDKVDEEVHPFIAGEIIHSFSYGSNYSLIPTDYKIIKATKKTVTLQHENDKPIVRTPKKQAGRCYKNGFAWVFQINNCYHSIVTKEI